MDRISVMDDKEKCGLVREALLDRQLRAVRDFALDPNHPRRYDATRAALQGILQPAGPQEKVYDLAEERRAETEQFYRSIGIFLAVSKPAVSNREFDRRRKAGQELFFRFATASVSYEAFMAACGDHWTVDDEDARAKIGWETAAEGYWFWAEAQELCPRTGTSWNDFSAAIRLLSLEEYVIVWHERKSQGITLDVTVQTWLRTRFSQSGALSALGGEGGVRVGRWTAAGLAGFYGLGGGRVAEVVTAA